MASVLHPHGDPGLVELGRLKVNEHHDDLVAECLGAGNEINASRASTSALTKGSPRGSRARR